MNEYNYSKLSHSLTKQINKEDKKKDGIYFTPPRTIHTNLKFLEPYINHVKNVLEPSCGSCEYVLLINKLYSNLKITGIEYNKTIFESIKTFENKNVVLLNENYLVYENPIKYDLIIGNPPYYVMNKSNVDSSYYNYFDGRPNIFILFIIKSLKMLTKNGILSFVLPSSFFSCLYYDKTRKYISRNFKILNLLECKDDYIETKQETIILILQQVSVFENEEFILDKGNYTLFGIPENITKLKTLYNNSSTLRELGFNVNVGNIVWNQCKADLTDDKSKTLLIYSSDIKDNKLNVRTYQNKDKKNYIHKRGSNDPILVINRGYGVGNYNFDYCLIEGGFEYLIENHLICIKPTKTINNKDLISLYRQIIQSFEDNRTLEFIKLYFGNSAINTTELCEILPMYGIST